MEERENLFHPHQEDDYEETERRYEDRVETEKLWEMAFLEGEKLARETEFEQEDW